MNDLASDQHGAASLAPDTLAKMSITELRAELGKELTLTARHLQRLSIVWRELELRGEDLSHLKSGLWSYMPMIASRAVRAELVVQYAGHAALLRRLANLPVEEQDRVLADGRIPVARRVEGEIVVRETPLNRLSISEMAKVFTAGGIRSGDDQIEMLTAERPSARSTASGPVAVDAITKSLDDEVAGVGRTSTVSVSLSSAELAQLHAEATNRNTSVSKLVRAALLTCGLIKASTSDETGRRGVADRDGMIRDLVLSGKSPASIAAVFGISRQRVYQITSAARADKSD